MYRQMDIFDFIEKLPENQQVPPQTQFEQLFRKVKDPVSLCTNCLCNYCVNNVEQTCDKVKPGEMQEPCFNCDECREYSGESQFANQRKEECPNFVMSDYGARRNRKQFRLIRGVKREGGTNGSKRL